MPDLLLRLDSVTYRYPEAETPALESVSAEVEEGELVLVAGVSGSGKSTLLRAASGLVPHFFGGSLSGTVTVGGLDTRDHGPAEVAGVASSLFQDPESQVVMSSVGAEVALPLEARGRVGAAVTRAVEETALALGVGNLLERDTRTLSGGELQRVALAAALVTQPRLLLLDEPTSQLDPVAGDELIAQLRRLNEEWGTSVLLAEQRIERCLAAADRVLAFDRGRLAWDGPPRTSSPGPKNVPRRSRRRPPGCSPLPGFTRFRSGSRTPAARFAHGHSARTQGLPRPRPIRNRGALAFAAARGRTRQYSRRSGCGSSSPTGPAPGRPRFAGWTSVSGPARRSPSSGETERGRARFLRTAAGVLNPARGRIEAAGEVALLLQNPSDYLVHERVLEELPAAVAREALVELGLVHAADRDPRDMSGGERQRLALGIVLAGRGIGGGAPPAVVALDEPTRGLDRGQKALLADRLRALAARGAAVLTATHDVEFAATLASRCVLLGRGTVMADGPTAEVLSGGRYFATEVSRVLWPATGVVLPEGGAAWLLAGSQEEAVPA